MSEGAQLNRLLEVGRIEDAKRLLASAIARAPGDPGLSLFAARIAMIEQDAAEARRQLERALLHDPGSFEARYLLYHLELAEKRYGEAERSITELIRGHPQESGLIASYADLMLRTLHLDRARLLIDEALRLDPHDRRACLTDVLLSTVEGRRDRADAQLSDLVREDPDGLGVARALLVTLVGGHRHAEALAIAQQLLRAQPDDADLVELITELRARTHWLAWPVQPLVRFGWGASAAIWLLAVVVLNRLRTAENPWTLAAGGLYLGWAAYTWAYTPLMIRWIRLRGL